MIGICSGISTKWLFIHCFQTELEFRSVDFCGGRKTGEPGEKPWTKLSKYEVTSQNNLIKVILHQRPS